MTKKIHMPKLGMSENDLQLAEWYKKEGDKIAEGEEIAAIEADKITNVIESPINGILQKIHVEAGEVVAIGTLLAEITEAGEETPTPEPSASGEKSENLDIKIEKQGNYKEKEVKGMRKVIAERMYESFHNCAPVVLMRSVDITKVKSKREELKIQLKDTDTAVPSYNDFMVKAAALALEKHPNLNSTYQDKVIKIYEEININIAVALEEGLITPVIKNTNNLSLWEINNQSKKLSQKAREGTLSENELNGGTFTVTNLGMKGIELSTPILNPPQVAILAVGTIKPYLKLVDGKVEEKFESYLSLTLDHRIIDGYPGAEFLETFVEIIENADFDLTVPENKVQEPEK